MKNKKECEIVQDLLVNYVDDVLNPESKKLVEEHLIECNECERKLKQIKEDVKNNDNKEHIELDYLKKLRIKSKIKSICMTLGILFIIFSIYYFIKFIKINDIINKSEEFSKSNNYYIEKITSSDGKASAIKTYYKDGKYKEVMELYSDDKVEKYMERYSSISSNEIITIDYRNNVAIIEDSKYTEMMNNGRNNKKNLLEKIQKTFTTSITTDTYDIGKEYYVLKDIFNKNDRYETWVDIETGLVIRRISKDASKTYFAGTDIIKSVSNIIEDYKYESGNVTDEDVNVPDLSNYEVKYDTTMNDLINDAIKKIEQD
ncbi:MAG: zf-HC2 domain-containing protein [Clostridia bacterium]|nr:zf-HC2 domain-containing protein [Clostridia bacterium]